MRLLPALLLLCPALAWSARTAFQVRCEDTIGKAGIEMRTRQGGYSINNSLSWRTLDAMRNTTGKGHVLGLTRTESRMAFESKGALLRDKTSGYECISPRMAVSLFYTPAVIYVGREFAPGSCAYREILAHEMRHLKTYLDHLPKVESVVRAALVRRFDNKPQYAPAGQAEALLEQEIEHTWMPYIKNEMNRVEPLQAAIDTPQEYTRLSKVCAGEVQSIIGPANRTKAQK